MTAVAALEVVKVGTSARAGAGATHRLRMFANVRTDGMDFAAPASSEPGGDGKQVKSAMHRRA